MEFNNELAAFQGALLSADNVHDFSTISSKGGNEEKTNYVIETLKRFLKAENYMGEDGLLIKAKMASARKFALFIIYNADLEVLNDMMSISEVEPLIWTIPTVPKYLMCEMMWQLHFEPIVYEVISKCWPQMGLEVARAFLENFKYLNPNDCLDKLGKISASCYALLCRLNYITLEDALLSTLIDVYEILEKFLKYYTNPPNKHRLDALSTDELYVFKGKRLINILNLVHDCANMFTQEASPLSDEPIYKVTYTVDYVTNLECKVCESPCELALAYVNKSNKLLLDLFQEIVMDISVDIFCAWSEFVEENKSMQQTVGELCDKVLTKLQSISSLSEHTVLAMLQMMARKPTNINDIINTVDINIILDCVNNPNEESHPWIRALVYKENLLEHIELVHVVKNNLNLFDDKDSFKLYNTFKMATLDSNRELLLSTKIKLFHKCNVLDKHEILKEQFKDKIFFNTTLNEDFDIQVNVMFNQFISDIDVDFTDILTLFYQNPRKILGKILGYATQNDKLTEPMLKLLTLLRDYTEYSYNNETDPTLILIMKFLLNQNLHPVFNCNIVKFICALKSNLLVSSSQLLMLVVMPSIHEALTEKDISKMHTQVKLLIEAYTIKDLMPYRAPILVMLGQMMEIIRLKSIDKFELNAIRALAIVIRFQKSLMKTYRQAIPDTDSSWLRQKLQTLKMHPLNFYYFKSLWIIDHKSFFEFVTGCRIHKNARLNSLSLQLTQHILPYATLEEWYKLWDNFIDGDILALDALRMYHSTVHVMNQKVATNRTANTVACLLYSYGNLIHIIRYKYLREPLTDFQVTSCCVLLAHNLKSTDDADVMDLEKVIMPLFAYLAERKNDYRANVPQLFVNTNFLYTAHKFLPSVNGLELL